MSNSLQALQELARKMVALVADEDQDLSWPVPKTELGEHDKVSLHIDTLPHHVHHIISVSVTRAQGHQQRLC